IEQTLALDLTPASWPIGMGRDFLATYHLFADALLLFDRGSGARLVEPVRCRGLDDPKLGELLPEAAIAKLREEVEMARGLCPPFDLDAYRAGLLRQRAQQLWRARAAARRRRPRAAAAAAAGGAAPDPAGRDQGCRIRLQ